MSHFSVLVVGNNVDEQLLPYHEFECTGLDEYIVDVDETEKYLKDYEKHGEGKSPAEFVESWFGYRVLKYGETPDITGDDKYGYACVDRDGNIKVINRTNPNAKWDYYTIGGRWSGFFRVKGGCLAMLQLSEALPDGYSKNRLPKKWIDFDYMQHEAQISAEEEYDAFIEATNGVELIETWEEILAMHDNNDHAARSYWMNHPFTKALNTNMKYRYVWMLDSNIHERFFIGQPNARVSFARRARSKAISTYAVVKDGEWYEKGRMGWWGISSGDDPNWSSKFDELIKDLPEDTVLTIVDCHI